MPSPFHIANIGAKRCNVGSTLLQSAARPSHSACKRQFFNRTDSRQHKPGATYPNLPNVFSNTQRATLDGLTIHGQPLPQSCVLPTQTNVDEERLQSVEPCILHGSTSGLWSEPRSVDSSYLVAGAQKLSMYLTRSPSGRVQDWLFEICSLGSDYVANDHDRYQDIHYDRTVSGTSTLDMTHKTSRIVGSELNDFP